MSAPREANPPPEDAPAPPDSAGPPTADLPPAAPAAFPIVGLGASAGGIPALMQFFDHMPAEPGMAFVIIMHLSPEHDSGLAAVLQPHTAMPVTQATEAVTVQPNHIYVIPPAKHIQMSDSTIHLVNPVGDRSRRAPIDYFFRTLAETHGSRAAGVVLSGTGADGAVGLPRIRELGGVTLVQDPGEAEHQEMPRNAIATGMIDYVLPVAALAAQLQAYWDKGPSRPPPGPDEAAARAEADHLAEILAFLRIRTGHNFAAYKRSTVLRRLERRMQVNDLSTMVEYLTFLREHPTEIQALLRDLLISVTNFFRDPPAWEALQAQVIPRLFANRDPHDPVRVWVAGCATGEEAYSVAMLLHEQACRLEPPPSFQIFATDLDDRAIALAREGSYPETINLDVSADRLRQFFTHDRGRYVIRQEIRDTVLFAVHDVLKDPPFSRLDLITCRNLLIYLNKEAQEQLMVLFHFALRPDAFLFLGMSEATDGVPHLYSTMDKHHHLFARRAVPRALAPIPTLSTTRQPSPLVPVIAPGPLALTPSAGELHIGVLEQYAPPSVLVNENSDILHLSPRAGRYLQFAPGEPSYNLLRVIHPDLRLDARSALYTALHKGKSNETRRIAVRIDGNEALVRLIVQPAQEPQGLRGYALVIFDEIEETPEAAHPAGAVLEPLARQLEEEAQLLREQLRVTIEQYETSVEELRASNEELQAMNEELRSASEELETSKEELQAVNEELLTVNQELKSKVEEVSRVNSDLQNLMAASDIGTVFLDRDLRVKRYTPQVQRLFNIIPTDINRPLAHVTHKFQYSGLLDDVRQVLQKRTVVEREIQTSSGEWYLVRLLPYRTLDDRIDGVVVTFIDITERTRFAQEREALNRRLQAQQAQFEAVVQQMPAGLIITEASGGQVIYSNAQADRLWPPSITLDAEVNPPALGFHPDGTPLQPADWPLARAIAHDEAVVNEEIIVPRPDGQQATMLISATPIHDAGGQVTMAVMSWHDVTAGKQMEEALRQARDQMEQRVIQRTEELAASNTALQSEAIERLHADQARSALLHALVTAQEDEQRHISRELHDQFGQSLTGLKFLLDTMARRGPARDHDQLDEASAIVNDLMDRVSELTLDLRPAVLDDMGVLPALVNLIERFTTRTGITVDFQHHGLEGRLAPTVETTIYRIMQEALTNVARHSGATEATVEVVSDHDVIMRIQDSGRGFDPARLEGPATGLLGMRERAALVGGTLIIESAPGAGTRVLAEFPKAPEPPAGNLAGPA
jgi:chemotaxis methyl-accepting protein methylase/signal transduction histidine kinase